MMSDISTNSSKQRRIGVILSYILIVLNMVVGIVVTPLIIGSLGDREYGLYQTIASFAHNLAILDFGIGTTITRYLSKYRATEDKANAERVLYSVARMTLVFSFAVIVLGMVLSFLISTFYKNTLYPNEISRAKIVFILLVVNVSVTLLDHYFVGVCTSYERFQFINSNKIVKVFLRVVLIFFVLRFYSNAIAISLIDLFITVLFLVIDFVYCKCNLKLKIKKSIVPKALTKEILLFGSTIFLQAFVNQANSNVDKVLLGAMSAAEVVTIYSVAMQIFVIYSSISSVISSVYLPYVTKRVHSGASTEEINNLIIGPGRKQLMITGLTLVGFIVVGNDFIRLWMGDDYLEAWLIAVIIMIPSMIELVENIAVSVTLAKGKNGIRTIIIACSAVFNILCTIIFINLFGPIGAPIATALSYLFGYIIAVNIFYKIVIGINVLYVFKNIFRRTGLCLLLLLLISLPLTFFPSYNFVILLFKVLFICSVFAILLILYGFSKEEKNELSYVLSKFVKR